MGRGLTLPELKAQYAFFIKGRGEKVKEKKGKTEKRLKKNH